MIEEKNIENENGEQERIVTCSSKSKQMNYVTQWAIDSENRRMKLVTGEKARSMGNVQQISKTTLDEHRKEVKEYLLENTESDEDDYESDDDENDYDTDDEDTEECDEDDERKEV